jgi:DNA-binding transcriptional LysR family regulator
MVMAGFGMALFPIPAVDTYVARGDLWRLPPYNREPTAEVYVITAARGNLSYPETLFLTALKNRIQETPESERHFIWETEPGLPSD